MSQASVSPPFLGYALRRVVVAPDLESLRGPLHGRRQLPLHLDSSARVFYDFGTRGDRAQAYQLVLLEAADPADLEQWLQRAELLRLWPELYLPRTVCAAWESEHPIMARIGAGSHVPQLRHRGGDRPVQGLRHRTGPGRRSRTWIGARRGNALWPRMVC